MSNVTYVFLISGLLAEIFVNIQPLANTQHKLLQTKQMQFGKLISNVKLLWVMKNVRQCSDKQLYQLCTGHTSLQLSLFRPNSNTHRQVQFICNFLFFPVICSRWERSLLRVLTACAQHALVLCSKVRQKAKAFLLAAAAVPAL